MAKKSRRSKSSRKRRRTRRRGGALGGAPIGRDDLAGGWSSRMSSSQGGEFLKDHRNQHGGAALGGAPIGIVGSSALEGGLRQAAQLGGIDRAFREIGGMQDGGRRRRSRGGRRSRGRKSRGGGVLNMAPYGGSTMLLGAGDYQKAGLNPGYTTGGLEARMASQRNNL
jgi:hypothetical protein